jgi:hypothetical protein
MPYDIRKVENGFKVCKKGTQKCFSKEPIPYERAVKQRKAIGLSGSGISDYVIAIPSYDRVEVIQQKTLPLLLSRGVSSTSIYIFVANKQEEKKYKDAISSDKYNKIIVGKKGISYQRNFIIDYFPEDQYIIFIDDDINNVVIKKKGKVSDLADLDQFFKESYTKLKKYKKYLWATKNMYNPFYKNLAKEEAEIGLTQFSGDLMGVINRKKMKIKYTLERGEAEQMELSFMYQKEDGGVIRFNNVIVITPKLTDGGKIKDRGSKEERMADLSHNVKLLLKAYPEYVDKILVPDYSSREKIQYKNLPLQKIEGAGKKLDIDFDDKKGENVYYSKIEDSKKYEDLKKRLFDKLEVTKIPKIEGRRKDDKRTRGDLLGYNAYTMTFGCGGRMTHGIGEFNTNAIHPELFNLIIEYGNLICPKGFKYQAITINKNMKAKKHKDGSNNGMSVINGLGDFTGGGLFVYKEKSPDLYDLQNHILVFNGAKLAHRTDVYKGTRYTLIFYTQRYKCENKGKVMVGSGFFDDEDLEEILSGGADKITMTLHSFNKEHNKLVGLLEQTGHKLINEAKDQAKEQKGWNKKLEGGICPKTGKRPCECIAGGALYAKDKYDTGEKQLTAVEKSKVKKKYGETNPEIAEIVEEPMGDDDIKKYFPNAKILKYSDLKNYTDITELLQKPKTFFFLLYERSPNVGHWVLVSRYKDNGIDTIEFFCSYGSKIDAPLSWTPIGIRVQLGEDKPYLSMLLDKSPFRVIYNPIQYQSKKSHVATCGAYDTLRASELVKHNTTLDEFTEMLEEVKKATGLSYDEIVANLVDLR